MRKITIIVALVAAFVIAVRGQSFINLNFESAYNLTPNPPGNGVSVAIANALPGWAAYDGPNPYSDIYYISNSFPGYSTVVELEGGKLALGGDFSVGLYEGGSISQTGTVPDNAESLLFEAEGPGAGGSIDASDLSVTLGGQTLAYSALSESSGYTVYGANIPAGLDGQMEALSFGCDGVGSGNVLLDNIEFSTSSVPEPGEGALLGLGVVLVAVRRRRSPGR